MTKAQQIDEDIKKFNYLLKVAKRVLAWVGDTDYTEEDLAELVMELVDIKEIK